ncbi:MAG: bifunctional glutamate N-acetyltransferase/amino-acid acetyltransferase ArgJ [Alphaproteobacteria bacterium]|nr:bifunctional glutamate N-acetyltransferase/amino-acid acetyltransferase ArgJ [Alphaproteobacteria bacterium]
MTLSPLAPAAIAELPPIAGVRLNAAAAGIRYPGRPDLLLAEFGEGTVCAGVFTTSLTAAAPVLLCREHVKSGAARVLVVNSGNSNAFTGRAGDAALSRVQDAACALAGCEKEAFYMASTGVIGEPLPDQRITQALPALHASLAQDGWNAAARAIMTTDTFPKQATRKARIGGTDVTLNGIAKGSGMIAPDMATMLAFFFTDAAIPAAALQPMLEAANAQSFNCITVDGDTSTSDTVLLFATGKAGNAADDYGDFARALSELTAELAQAVVRDGEGASKFITIDVTGAEHDAAARRIAMSIANSPLVKTAIAGEDANWGRIVMAVGKAGERADRDALTIAVGGVTVARNGAVAPEYREAMIEPHMKGREITIAVDVGIGSGRARVWTCDLTHGYIDINGSYRS